uniref:Uncharacterized protein n=1 Tax=Oryza nivara TaxID=4536 RepID=A0A0E0I1A4_ORYNI
MASASEGIRSEELLDLDLARILPAAGLTIKTEVSTLKRCRGCEVISLLPSCHVQMNRRIQCITSMSYVTVIGL